MQRKGRIGVEKRCLDGEIVGDVDFIQGKRGRDSIGSGGAWMVQKGVTTPLLHTLE